MIRTTFVALSALVLAVPSAAGERGFKTRFVGGAVPDLPVKSGVVIKEAVP